MECPTVAPLELVSLFSFLPLEPAECKRVLYVSHICEFRVAGLIESLLWVSPSGPCWDLKEPLCPC